MRRVSRSFACLVVFLGSLAANAEGALKGVVRADGHLVQGAMVTARSNPSGIETTVFTDENGAFELDGLEPGPYQVQAKFPGFQVDPVDRTLDNEDRQPLELELAAIDDLPSSLPSSTWLSLLPEGEMKREFILNCASCHEISHDRVFIEGKPRDAAQWLSAIHLMRGIDVYGLTPPDFDDARYAEWLALHLGSEEIAKLEAPAAGASGPVLSARITEYPVPKSPCLPHDLVIGPDGRIWITAFYHNVIWALDPATGAYETFPVNEKPEVMGQVRALTFAPDGMLWVLLGGTESLVRLDPESRELKSYPLGMYPHSIELDSKGKLWFNDYLSASKRFGSLDPASGKVELYKVPGKVLEEGEGLPLLYGLQVDPADVVWGTMLAANTVFGFDPRSEAVRLFDMPEANSGPRRPGIAPDGSLWIPEFNTGSATRFDPKTEEFTRYELGASALGPYDIAVDPRNGHVWVAAALGSSMIRLDPETGRRDVFPFPTEPAYPRHIAIDPGTGDVWTAYSSMPDATPKIVRIELDP